MNSDPPTYWQSAIQKNPWLASWYTHWAESLDGRRSPLADELPWMTYGAIEWLAKTLTQTMAIFEWGSGGSTMFFSQRVRGVVTVEHDADWFAQVNNALLRKGAVNVNLMLEKPRHAAFFEPLYGSSDARFEGQTFGDYVTRIDKYPDEYFDIVIVDGRARNHCISHAVNRIKRGGYLLLDNSEREEYRVGWSIIQHWPTLKIEGPGPYNSYSWETRIWRKGL